MQSHAKLINPNMNCLMLYLVLVITFCCLVSNISCALTSDAARGIWTALSSLSNSFPGVSDFATVSRLNDDIIILGGLNSLNSTSFSAVVTNEVYLLRNKTQKWEKHSTVGFSPRGSLGAIVDIKSSSNNGNVTIFGGEDSTFQIQSGVLTADTSRFSYIFTDFPVQPSNFSGSAFSVAQAQDLNGATSWTITGGMTGPLTYSARVLHFDGSTQLWSNLIDLPQGRSYHASGYDSQYNLYVIGGENFSGALTDVILFNAQKGWRVQNPNAFNGPLSQAQLIIDNRDHLIVAGGRVGGEFPFYTASNAVYQSGDMGVSWTEVYPRLSPFTPRWGHSLQLLSNGYLVLIAGRKDFSQQGAFSDVYITCCANGPWINPATSSSSTGSGPVVPSSTGSNSISGSSGSSGPARSDSSSSLLPPTPKSSSGGKQSSSTGAKQYSSSAASQSSSASKGSSSSSSKVVPPTPTAVSSTSKGSSSSTTTPGSRSSSSSSSSANIINPSSSTLPLQSSSTGSIIPTIGSSSNDQPIQYSSSSTGDAGSASPSSGLSKGAIVAISVGASFVVLVLIYFCIRKIQRNRRLNNPLDTDLLYSDNHQVPIDYTQIQ
jgi:hypothetical protein